MDTTDPDAHDSGHIAVLVSLTLVEQASAAFLPLIESNAQESLAFEAQCHRFDICVNPAVPDEVLLYEIYENRAAFDAHLETKHFQHFERESSALVAHKSVRIYSLVQ